MAFMLQYYTQMLESLLLSEKSYDSLINQGFFPAVDKVGKFSIEPIKTIPCFMNYSQWSRKPLEWIGYSNQS